MTVTCPEGHQSEATDYCDTCGTPIAAGAVSTGGLTSGDLPSGGAVPPSVAGSVLDLDPAEHVATVTCPHCGGVNVADALFCESCGYDFTTGTPPLGDEPEPAVDEPDEPEVEPEPEVEVEVEVGQRESDESDTDEAVDDEPNTDEALDDQSDDELDADEAVDEPDADQAVDDEPDADGPEADGPDADKADTDEPDADAPEADKPEESEAEDADEASAEPDVAAQQAGGPGEQDAETEQDGEVDEVHETDIGEDAEEAEQPAPVVPAPPQAPEAPAAHARPRHTPPSRALSDAWVVEVWIDPDWYAVQQTEEAVPSPGVPDIVVVRRNVVLVGRPSGSLAVRPDVDAGADSAVSRRHAQLTSDGRRWWIEDLGSSNGTFIGVVGEPLPTRPITPGQRVEIDRDDRIYVGAWTRLVIRQATASEQAGQG